MSYLLTDIGEELLMKFNMDGLSHDVGLYNDSTDGISETDDVSAISTEPTGSAYARQTSAYSVSDISGDWGFDNDSQLTFDVSDSSSTVDGSFLVHNFASTDAGDGGTAADHLIGTAALSQSRDLSQIDTLEISVGGSGVTVS